METQNTLPIKSSQQTKKKRLVIKGNLPAPQAEPILPAQPIIEESKQETPRYNETFIEVLERLAKLMSQKGDFIRSRVYTKAQDTLRGITTDITSVDQLKGKAGIGPTILEKLTEYVNTGTLQLFEREKDKPEYILSEIYGVGPKKAEELVKKGITTIAQLRERQDELLNPSQKAGLKYYEDILERIPRSEIDEYNALFQSVFKEVATGDARYEIVGSYRRGAATSGDIDVIITSIEQTMFSKFVESLQKKEVIVETLSFGKTKCLVIARLPNHKTARRVDFMYTSPEEYPFAVLYFTGSKTFNTVMRGHALKMGVSLNEHGLYKKESGKAKEEKIATVFKEEKDIFDYLKLQYKEPVERVDGRSVVTVENFFFEPVAKEQTKKKRSPKEKETKKVKEPKKPKELNAPKEPKKPKSPKDTTRKIKKIKKEEAIQIESEVKKIEKLIEPAPVQTEDKIPIAQIIPRETETTAKIIIKVPKNKTVKEEKKNIEDKSDIKQAKKMSNAQTKKNLNDFKTKGQALLEATSEKEITEMVVTANVAYYNTNNPLITDNEYDIIREYAAKKYPENEALKQVGAPIEKNKVTLPYNMPSMNKIKPDTNALANWMGKYKGPYVLSCKLDGVSGMYSTEGPVPKLYTRGDGKIGQDITHLLRILKLPVKKAGEPGIVVRGEFIIPKRVFEEKYAAQFANPRNLVSGIVNSKTLDDKTRDLHFVTYEVIHPPMKTGDQMAKLKELGHEVVQNRMEQTLTNELLSETLLDWRANYEYEIDGVIVADNNLHPRVDGNPDHAFAFKMVISDQMAEAKVVDVLWNPSKSGYLKPRVQIEPIRLGGVTIEYATGFNGSFIEANKIGVGALIQIIRSGDVIPHIKSVTTPAEIAKMPDAPYHWTDTHVDIILDNISEDATVREKNITAFFTGIEVDGLSSGNVKRIMKAGYDTIPKVLKMEKADFEEVEGFKGKMVEKIYNGIHDKIEKASLLTIMAASNMFGRGIGERKIKPMLEAYPDILTRKESKEQKITMLKGIKGIGNENAKSFVEHIDEFMAFLKECGLESKLNSPPIVPEKLENKMTELLDTTHPLYQKHIVMTKVRDATIIEGLKKVGGVLDDNVGKNTFALVVKSKDDVSNKTKYAVDHNIPMFTPAEFISKYMA
jgi:NAD-dependent DNA ligase/DNA polymerase/3'-5' exonuclease PolX